MNVSNGNMIRAYVNNAAYFQATGKNSLFNSSFSMLFIILTALPNEFLLPKCLRINLRRPIFSLSIIYTTPRIRSHSKYDIKNENTDAIFICSNWNKAKFIIFVRNISTAIVTFVEPTWFNYYDKNPAFRLSMHLNAQVAGSAENARICICNWIRVWIRLGKQRSRVAGRPACHNLTKLMKSKENQFAFPGCSAHAFFFFVCCNTRCKTGKECQNRNTCFFRVAWKRQVRAASSARKQFTCCWSRERNMLLSFISFEN